MVLKPNKEHLEEIKRFDEELLKNNKQIYDASGIHSKVVRTLRKNHYNYVIYKILSILKTKKMQHE